MQFGFMILLGYGAWKAIILSFRSMKSKRVVRSVPGADIFSFADTVEERQMLRHDLRILLCHNLPLRALTDSSSMFSIIIRSTTTTERNLMVDLQAAREAFDKKEFAGIERIRRGENVADELRK